MRVWLAVTWSVTLSFMGAVGVNLQKFSMGREEERLGHVAAKKKESANKPRPPHRQPLWVLGMTILVLDACGDFVLIGLAPQSLLGPLGSLSLGFNLVLAPLFHGTKSEKVTVNVLLATALIYVGTIFAAVHAASDEQKYDLDSFYALLTNAVFLTYLGVCIVFQTFLYKRTKQRRRKGRLGGTNGGHDKYGVVDFCGLAGCFGGQSVLCAKSLSELIKNAIVDGNNNGGGTFAFLNRLLHYPSTGEFSLLPCFFLTGTVCCVLTQVGYLNKALAGYEALIAVPIYQTFLNGLNIAGGMLYFGEYRQMNLPADAVSYSFGLITALAGIAMLVNERSRQQNMDGINDETAAPGNMTVSVKSGSPSPEQIEKATWKSGVRVSYDELLPPDLAAASAGSDDLLLEECHDTTTAFGGATDPHEDYHEGEIRHRATKASVAA